MPPPLELGMAYAVRGYEDEEIKRLCGEMKLFGLRPVVLESKHFFPHLGEGDAVYSINLSSPLHS